MIPRHDVDGVLREVAGARRVLRTRLEGVACVTRVLLGARVDPGLGPLVEQAARFGRGSLAGVPEELLLTLEGYRVAARLPHPDPRWPDTLAAGVNEDGYAFVTTRWIEGVPLHQAAPLALPDRRRVARAVLAVLAELHARHIAHGDLKPENVVLTPDGGVAVIDLDTLREVGGPGIPAITRDLTRSWAAPEQQAQQRTWLASDLWAWSKVVAQLFPEGAPEAWRTALDACRLADPMRRPRTDVLLRALDEGGELEDWAGRPTPGERDATGVMAEQTAVSTERVPEAVRTERVPETTPSEPTLSPRPAARPRRWGCLHVAVAAVVAPVATCGGLAAWIDHRNVIEANRLADESMAALKAHKVRRELNDAGQRGALRAMAEGAWEVRHTPRSSAVRALAVVWAQGWQDAGRAWDAAKYAEGLDAVDAVEDSRQPEALLARGTLYGAACRLNRRDATAAAACDRALDALADFQARLPEDAASHWLRVEGAWTEVLVRTEIATQQLDAGLPEATAVLAGALERCDAAGVWLAWAPVNGPELVQDCLRVAGLAGDVDRWLALADRLVAPDAADGLERATVWHLYTGAGRGCEVTTVEKRRGEWAVKGSPWCVAMGHAARRCWASADAAADARAQDPDRPWTELDEWIAKGDGDWSCLR
ncbi:MAG: protein kinase domain-containing protein [Myxococcota bacterium]